MASLSFAPLEEMRRHALTVAPMAECVIAMLQNPVGGTGDKRATADYR